MANRLLAVALILTAVAAAFSAELFALYFKNFERPKLFASGFVPQGQFKPRDASAAPAAFSLAKSEKRGESFVETYVGNNGDFKEVVIKNGTVISTTVECRSRKYGKALGLLGFSLFAVGVVARGARSGVWLTLPWMRTSRMEFWLVAFGGLSFIASILSPTPSCAI